MDSIGARLRQERLRLGLTQVAIAAVGGVATNAQHAYESGKRMPRADYLAEIGQCGVDLVYVCLGRRTPTAQETLTVMEAAVVKAYRALGELDQRAIEQVLLSMNTALGTYNSRQLP